MLGLPLVAATGPALVRLSQPWASSVLSAQLAQGTSLGSDHLGHFTLQLILGADACTVCRCTYAGAGVSPNHRIKTPQ